MAVATFDTLKFANSLKAAGVPDKQAEAEATVLSEALATNFKELATKDDLRETEQRLNAKIDTVVAKLNGEMVLIKYMFGIVVTLLVGVMIRLFFVHNP